MTRVQAVMTQRGVILSQGRKEGGPGFFLEDSTGKMLTVVAVLVVSAGV